MSRGLRILVGVAAVLYIGALVAVVYTLAEQQSTGTRIARAEKFDPCVSLSEAVANKATDRIKPLTRECREFLNGIGPLVTIKLSCAIIEKARYICPAPGTDPRRPTDRESVPLGPALTAAPMPESGDAPPDGTGDGTKGGTRKPPKTQKPTPAAESPPHTTDTTADIPPVNAPVQSTPPPSVPADKPGPVKSTLETVGETVKPIVCPLTERLLGTCPN